MAKSGISLKLEGADALRDALQRIPVKVAKRVETTGCRKGAQDLRRKLRAGAPRGATGQLRKSIRYRRIKYRRGAGLVGFKVFSGGLHERLGAGDSDLAAGYKLGSRKIGSGRGRSFIPNTALLRMFEYGGSAHPGFPRRPFWNRTVGANQNRLVNTILGAMGDAVDLEAGKEFARQKRSVRRR